MRTPPSFRPSRDGTISGSHGARSKLPRATAAASQPAARHRRPRRRADGGGDRDRRRGRAHHRGGDRARAREPRRRAGDHPRARERGGAGRAPANPVEPGGRARRGGGARLRARRSGLGPPAGLGRGAEADRADRRGARAPGRDRLAGRRAAARHRAPDPRGRRPPRQRSRALRASGDRPPAHATDRPHRPDRARERCGARRRDPERDLPRRRGAARFRPLGARESGGYRRRGDRLRRRLLDHLRLGLSAHLLGGCRADPGDAPALDPDRGRGRLAAARLSPRPPAVGRPRPGVDPARPWSAGPAHPRRSPRLLGPPREHRRGARRRSDATVPVRGPRLGRRSMPASSPGREPGGERDDRRMPSGGSADASRRSRRAPGRGGEDRDRAPSSPVDGRGRVELDAAETPVVARIRSPTRPTGGP